MMRGLRRLLALSVAAFLIFVWFGVFFLSQPAYADDCKTRVKKIGDIANQQNVQDCLRTGSNYGRVIGTVVGVTGVVIAGVGLKPPPKKDPPKRTDNPCDNAKAGKELIDKLNADYERLQLETLQQWRALAAKANLLAVMFRDLKEAEWESYLAWVSGWTVTGAGIGLVILPTIGLLRVAAAELAGTTAAASPTFIRLALTSKSYVEFTANTAALMGQVEAGAALILSWMTPDNVGVGNPLARKKLWTQIARPLSTMATLYMTTAKSYNNTALTWGAEQQQKLDSLRDQIRDALDSWRNDWQNCPDRDMLVPPISRETPPGVTLNVLQAPTEWGTGWFLGGLVY